MLKYLRILLSPIESVIVSQVPVNYKVMNFLISSLKKPWIIVNFKCSMPITMGLWWNTTCLIKWTMSKTYSVNCRPGT